MYFPANMLTEIQTEAARLDRSMSWIVQKAWTIAQTEIASYRPFGDKTDQADVKPF